EQTARLARFAQQIADVERELQTIESDTQQNLAVQRLTGAITTASAAVTRAETVALEGENKLVAARESESRLRETWTMAERTAQKLQTEVETLAKVLNVQDSDLWPPLIDAINVEKGLEGALGAALGDDLDVPADQAAPAHWSLVQPPEPDPVLPAGAVALSRHVKAPDVLARRLEQIGLVDREQGLALQKQLKPGQRLVSRQGDLWRWDGFVAGAEAPTAAAQRLAQRNRLAELEHQCATANGQASAAKDTFDGAAATTKRLIEEETQLRRAWREAQGILAEAQEKLAQAERAASQNTARLSALKEARIRLKSSMDEAATVKTESLQAREVLGETETLDARLQELQAEVTLERAQFADSKARFDGIARETQMRQQRLQTIASERQGWVKRKADAAHQIEVLT
ncbi:MAG: chromosome segregation protein SMC, partial [Anaerolineae bacterium]|nr:chromosome segregation protein SMC [Anaerolineae bacterium]